jgi:hypothetical protein
MKSLKEALNETRPWGQEPGAEWDEGPEDDAYQRNADRKERMAKWKSKKAYPQPGEQKPGFAKSPDGDLAEMDASQPNAPSSLAGPCNECGKEEGHALGCSRMNEGDEGTDCPECGAPHGMKHDKGCPLNDEGEPEHLGADHKRDIGEADDDEDEDDLLIDDEACPGCGSKPGDGINPKCHDPMGCGYWREFKTSADAPKGRSMRDMLKSPLSADDEGVRRGYGDREGFETEHGEWIENPFWDESGRDEVEPEQHYGDAFKKSGLAKRLRWGESSDFDGLPLTEGSMFDRFDTLVGHRFDGTFDARETEAMKLRALVKSVVREAWSTYDPKTGEETEHSYDDKGIEDLYVDKKQEARGAVREGDTTCKCGSDHVAKLPDGHVKCKDCGRTWYDLGEMKLSIAGPAFGAAASDTDNQDDDDDEDYKVLTPKKAPEPEQSGTRIKSKYKKSKS